MKKLILRNILLFLILIILLTILSVYFMKFKPEYEKIVMKVLLLTNPFIFAIFNYYLSKKRKKDINSILSSNLTDEEKIEKLKNYGFSILDIRKMKLENLIVK